MPHDTLYLHGHGFAVSRGVQRQIVDSGKFTSHAAFPKNLVEQRSCELVAPTPRVRIGERCVGNTAQKKAVQLDESRLCGRRCRSV